jgi:hypothetical protein
MWDSLRAIESDHIRDDSQAEELFKAGKMSHDDLRISLQINQAVAEERAAFRQSSYLLDATNHYRLWFISGTRYFIPFSSIVRGEGD